MVEVVGEGGADDSMGDEIELELDRQFPNGVRYVTSATLLTPTDVDRYSFQYPSTMPTQSLTATLNSLTSGFHATLAFRNENGFLIAAEPIVRSIGTEIVQVLRIEPGERINVEVLQHPSNGKESGNYELLLQFGDQPVHRETWQLGTISPGAGPNEHVLNIARTQLLQLGVLSEATHIPGTIRTMLVDSNGIASTEIRASTGELATQTYLVFPGRYRVIVESRESVVDSIFYQLSGYVVDRPLGPEPVDPTEDPYCGFGWLGQLLACFHLDGDTNDDGFVNFDDFLGLAQNFGKMRATRSDGDLTGDGLVDFRDFLILSNNFGHQIP